jgi:hypothetical protein
LPITGFPEFGQFCSFGFPEGTQLLKSLASTNSATPALAGNLAAKRRTAKAKVIGADSAGLIEFP